MLYMAVTADKYELPLSVCDSVKELSERFHMRSNTISSAISKNNPGKYIGYKFVKVDVDVDVEE